MSEEREASSMTQAVILAGGRSRRMGRDKALVEMDGETLLERQLRSLPDRFRRVLVSVPALGPCGPVRRIVEAASTAARPVEWVPDERDGQRGPLAGIEASLRRIESPRGLFVPVDVAAIDERLIRRLEDAAREPACLGVVPRWEGRICGTFAVYSREILDVVSSRLDRGDRRLGDLAGVDGVTTIDIGPDLAHVFRPLNTPTDLESWRASTD